MNIHIETLTDEHIEGFRQAVGSVAREKRYLGFLDTPPIEMTLDFVKSLRDKHMPQIIALAGNEVVGWCDISPLERPIFVHVGVLGMGIIDGYRGQGIGVRLIKTALDAAKERGLKRIELTVRDTNIPAIRLYEKMGFEHEGVNKKAVYVDGQYENHIFMALLWC